jgi:hypothetical protein
MTRRAPDLDRAIHRVTIALAAGALLFIPIATARVLGVLLVAGILPGLAIAGSRRFSRDASLGLSLALSPVLFGAVVLAALFLHMHMNVATSLGAAASLAGFVLAARAPSAPGGSDETRSRAGAWIVLSIAAAMALALPLSDTWWRVRSDSWFHAAVADRLAREGLPAMDPYFAGFRLQYLYFYHALLAACAALARIDLFHAMILLNAIALSSAAFAFHALSGLFARRAGPRVAGLCVWLFALNGWFYLFYPLRIARALAGDSRGESALKALFPWTPYGHDTALRLISVEGNQFMLLDKFMIGTAFSLTFGLAASVLFLLAKARRGEWSVRHDVALLLCISGATLFHAVTGVTVAVATLLVLALLLVARSSPTAGGPPYARLAAVVGLGFALAVPYLLSTMPRGNGAGGASIGFALQPGMLLGLFAAILPALFLALVFFRDARGRDGEVLGARLFSELSLSATGMIALWTAVVLAIALTVDLVTNNETKFAFLVHLPLAAFAVGAMERLWERPRARRAMILVVLSATLPLHALYFHHAVRDASAKDPSVGEKAAYAWIRARTPADAVVIDENDIVDVPVLASRDLYWGNEGYAFNWGYDPEEMRARRLLRDAVFAPGGMSEPDRLRLSALGRPVFVIYRTRADEFTDDAERFLEQRGFSGRFTAERVSVFEVDPGADAE